MVPLLGDMGVFGVEDCDTVRFDSPLVMLDVSRVTLFSVISTGKSVSC